MEQSGKQHTIQLLVSLVSAALRPSGACRHMPLGVLASVAALLHAGTSGTGEALCEGTPGLLHQKAGCYPSQFIEKVRTGEGKQIQGDETSVGWVLRDA